MAEKGYKVDIDEGKVEINGEWFDANALKKTIKKKVDKGDFDIADYAEGLKELEEALRNTKEFHIKLPMDIADYIEARAGEEDTTPGAVIRAILKEYIGEGGEADVVGEMEAVEEGEGGEEGEEEETEEEESREEEGEEEGKEEGAEAEPKAKPVKVKCPRCGTMILVTNPTRPLTITCPNCGERGVLTK